MILRRGGQEAVSPVIAVILMVAITVVLASLLYVWVMNFAETDESVEKFATVEVEIRDDADGDKLIIKIVDGPPLNWTSYKIIIYNNSDENQVATMMNLKGESYAGEKTTFNATNAPGFNAIDYKKDLFYKLEIYNIKESKRVYNKDYITCITFIPG